MNPEGGRRGKKTRFFSPKNGGDAVREKGSLTENREEGR